MACKSGKKMKKENRVFLISEKEATKQVTDLAVIA